MSSDVNSSWKPSPRYLLRKSVILPILKKMLDKNSSLIELGFGAGDLLFSSAKLGFNAYGFDFSESARHLAKERLNAETAIDNCTIFDSFDSCKESTFDTLVACEVLEHIEDDRSALIEWKSLLKANGTLIISVPSHMKKWGNIDVWAGHFRRYERKEITQKLSEAGFTDITVKCYGFPLTLALDPLLNRSYKSAAEETKDQNIEERTKASGITRKKRGIFDLITIDACLWPFYQLQKLFYPTELGSGYVVTARKR